MQDIISKSAMGLEDQEEGKEPFDVQDCMLQVQGASSNGGCSTTITLTLLKHY